MTVLEYVPEKTALAALSATPAPGWPTHYVTPSLTAYLALRKAGREVSGTWEYLDANARERTVRDATELMVRWLDPVREELSFEGVNVGDAARFSSFYFLLEGIAASRAWRELLSRRTFRTVRLPRHAGRQVRYGLGSPSDVPGAILAYQARHAGIKVEWMAAAPLRRLLNRLRLLYRSLAPASLRSLMRSVHAASSRSTPPGCLPLEALAKVIGEPGNGRLVLLAGTGGNFVALLALAGRLRQGGWRTALVHTCPEFDYRRVKADPWCHDRLARDGISPYLELSHLCRPERKVIRRLRRTLSRFKGASRSWLGEWPDLLSNPDLGFQFDYLFLSLFQDLAMQVRAVRAVLEKLRPDVALVSNASDCEWAVAAVAGRLGIPTVMVPHNRMWAHPECYDFPVDYIAVPSRGLVDRLAPITGTRRPIEVGDIVHEALTTNLTARPAVGHGIRLLVLIGWISPGVFQFPDLGCFYRALTELIEQAGAMTDWEVIIRVHPRSPISETIRRIVPRLAHRAEGRVRLEWELLAEELIERSDFVLLLDYKSSPAIRAWQLGRPVIYWQSSTVFYGEHDMQDDSLFPVARNFGELRALVNRFRADEAFRAQWVSKGRELYDTYYRPSLEAGRGLAEVLDEICRGHPRSASPPNTSSELHRR